MKKSLRGIFLLYKMVLKGNINSSSTSTELARRFYFLIKLI